MGFIYFGTPCITKFTTHNRQKSFSTLRHYKAIPVAKLNFGRHNTILLYVRRIKLQCTGANNYNTYQRNTIKGSFAHALRPN